MAIHMQHYGGKSMNSINEVKVHLQERKGIVRVEVSCGYEYGG